MVELRPTESPSQRPGPIWEIPKETPRASSADLKEEPATDWTLKMGNQRQSVELPTAVVKEDRLSMPLTVGGAALISAGVLAAFYFPPIAGYLGLAGMVSMIAGKLVDVMG